MNQNIGNLIFVDKFGNKDIILENKGFGMLQHEKKLLLCNSYYRSGQLLITYAETKPKVNVQKTLFIPKNDSWLRNS